MRILNNFQNLSRQVISINKSKLFVGPNVSSQVIRGIRRVCGIPIIEDLGKYLGVPLIHGRVTRQTYSYIINQQRLAGWKSQCLSIAGRTTLIQSVTAALLVYTMQMAWLPADTCEALDKINRRFLWSNKMREKGVHLVNWKEVTKPKHLGGLGIRRARESNIVVLAKNGWKIIGCERSIWVDMWRSKYVKNLNIFDCPSNNSISHSWRGMIKSLKEIKNGFKWKIGVGIKTSLWFDSWTNQRPLCDLIEAEIREEEINWKVCDILGDDNSWNLSKIQTPLNSIALNAILGVPVPRLGGGNDRLIWGKPQSGTLTAKEAYNFLQEASEPMLND